MLYLVIAVCVIFVAWVSTLAIRNTQVDNPSWVTLSEQRARTLAAVQEFLDARKTKSLVRCAPGCEHPKSQELYAALQKQNRKQALSLAEDAMAADSASADARLLLSLALLANGDLAAAAAQHESALERGARGGLSTYLSTYIELEEYLQSAAEGGKDSSNNLLMPIELLALELHVRLGDTGDASALWLPGQGGEISKEEAREFVIAHFSGYYRLVQTLIESLRSEDAADGIYLLARLTLKCGFSKEGAALLLPLEEVMAESYQHKAYQRDMALLRGERPIVTESSASDGRKVIKLNVLN